MRRDSSLQAQTLCLQRVSLTSLAVALVTLFLTVSVPATRAQIPVFPQAFYGAVTAAGGPAPAGTVIEARGNGVRTGIPLNPLVTQEAGKYGGPGTLDPKLLVQGTVADGTAVEFYVNGEKAQVAEASGEWRESYPFKSNGVVLLNLRVQTALPPAPPTTPTRTPSPVPPTATRRPPETAVPTATHRPQEATAATAAAATAAGVMEMPPAATATEIPPISEPSPTAPAPALVTIPTTGEASPAPTSAPATQTPALPATAEAATRGETAVAPSPTPTPGASPSPSPTVVTMRTARPTNAPILAGGQARPAANHPGTAEDTSRGLILGSGIVLLAAAVAAGMIFLVRRRWVR